MLALTALAGLMAFLWPLFVAPQGVEQFMSRTPFLFAAILPAVLALVLTELSSKSIDVKALAMLGVLVAVGAALRPMGSGMAGTELVFFVIILGGRAFGSGFGFLQGILTLFASALLTGGVGPWLPYQMIAAGFIGLLAGLLPQWRGKTEIVVLCVYGFVSAFVYGWLMDFALWPYTVGMYSDLSWDPTATVAHNLHTFVLYNLATSMGWNLLRGVTNGVAITVLGPGVLLVLRRTIRKANFVPEKGLEPSHLAAQEPKSCVSANSTTSARPDGASPF